MLFSCLFILSLFYKYDSLKSGVPKQKPIFSAFFFGFPPKYANFAPKNLILHGKSNKF